MHCFIADLRLKEVINICNGHRLGFVCDVKIDVRDGRVVAIVIPGPCKFFGLFGREDDFLIHWDEIRRVGDDIILVEVEGDYKRHHREKKKWF